MEQVLEDFRALEGSAVLEQDFVETRPTIATRVANLHLDLALLMLASRQQGENVGQTLVVQSVGEINAVVVSRHF